MSSQNSIVWQHLTNGQNWESFGTTSSNIEAAFASGQNLFNLLPVLSIDFILMNDSVSDEPIRRLTAIESPDVIYEWEEHLSQNNRIWTAYNTDDCEAMAISQRTGRNVIVLYLTHSNVPYEIDFTTRTQRNKISGFSRWIRRAPQTIYSASPSAMAPSVAALPMVIVIIQFFIIASFFIWFYRYVCNKVIMNPLTL